MEFSSLAMEAAERFEKQQEISETLNGDLPRELPGDDNEVFGDLPVEEEGTLDRKGEFDYDGNMEARRSEPIELNTINSRFEGSLHDKTDIPYERRELNLPNGQEVTGVFPEFKPQYETHLSEDMYTKSDREQFDYCNTRLHEAVENDPDLRNRFDDVQLEQIHNRDTPDGTIWHHQEEPGRMQLVDSYEHSRSGHTGGRSLWGGGSEMRGYYTNGVSA